MGVFVETITLLFQIIWLWILAIYKAVVPAKIQGYKNISGQIVLITGAGSGLGRLMSVRFAELGCQLVLWDIDQSGNETTAELVKTKGGQAHAYRVDLSKREEIYETAGKVKHDVGDVDILINNAGIVTGKKFLECSDSLIEKTMDVNCNAHYWTVKAFLPSMLAKNKGHIVSIASAAGMFGVAGLCDYCASKFAAIGFMESLRYELLKQKKDGVATTTVCPYYINTGMFDGVKTKLLTIIEPNTAVDRIMDAVLTNQAILMIPRLVYLLYMVRGMLPVTVGERLATVFGLSQTMDSFVGRNKKD